jgi:dolichol-phosphate mannosyltransferase
MVTMSIAKEFFVSDVDGIPDYSVNQFKKKNKRIALVIPVIDEGKRIINQLEKIKELDPEVDVIIADGGSTDVSRNYFFSENNIITVLLTKKSAGGLSAQLRMAFHYCVENDYEAIITMDGNDKDGPEGIQRFLDELSQGRDFIQGSRFIKGGKAVNTPILRLIAIRLLHAPLTSIAAGRIYTDSTNGFRGFRTDVIVDDRVNFQRQVFDSYELLAYLPIRISRLKLNCIEVPVSRTYPIGQKTPTKISGFRGLSRLMTILIGAALGKYNP